MKHLLYKSQSKGFEVQVQPQFLADQSKPADGHYVWAYHIRIENKSRHTAQLRNRHWIITDGLGRVQEVKGAGVVGEEPVIAPGDAHEYMSGVPLSTPSGLMQGSYEMEAPDGRTFQIRIPAFSLDSPHGPVH